jgi:hypothetical protein
MDLDRIGGRGGLTLRKCRALAGRGRLSKDFLREMKIPFPAGSLSPKWSPYF